LPSAATGQTYLCRIPAPPSQNETTSDSSSSSGSSGDPNAESATAGATTTVGKEDPKKVLERQMRKAVALLKPMEKNCLYYVGSPFCPFFYFYFFLSGTPVLCHRETNVSSMLVA
jgi:hypothetical protein